MALKPVGILGGMGPEATILLQQRVLAEVDARDDADHVPLLIDMNPQVPSRIAHLIEGTGPSPAPVLVDMARRLETMGATALAMACNTAHVFADDIRAAVSVPFLDMVELAASTCAVAGSDDRTIGLLGSPAVKTTWLYDRALEAHGLTPVWLDDMDGQLTAIRDIKAHGVTPDSVKGLIEASARLADRGHTVQLIACTEFSLACDRLPATVRAIDALDSLARAIVGQSRGSPEAEALS
ncbi:MAG: amino acid racemase [Pseudomonadota bacterium]